MNYMRRRQTFFNGGKIFAKSLFCQALKRRMPLFSTIYLTDRCNMRCEHCGIHTVNKKRPEFTTSEWIDIIDELCGMGCEWFRLLGGEPLLRADLTEIIDHITVKRDRIAEIVTNGLGLDRQMDRIKNLQFVGISLEGDRENQERVRGKGSFEPALRAVEACVAAGKYVRLHMVLNTFNIQESNVNFMTDLCRRHKIQFDFCRLMINPYFGEGGIPEYYYVPDDRARAFYKYILKRKIEENIPISNSVRALRLLIDWPWSYDKYILGKDEYGKEHPNYKIPECTVGLYTFELSSDGKMRHCVNLYDKEIDIHQAGGVRKAWEALASKPCRMCSHLSAIEQSLMLRLDFSSVANAAKLLLKR